MYMCVFNHHRECDGCHECEEAPNYEGHDDYIYDRMRDKEIDMIIEEMERKENERNS